MGICNRLYGIHIMYMMCALYAMNHAYFANPARVITDGRLIISNISRKRLRFLACNRTGIHKVVNDFAHRQPHNICVGTVDFFD